MDRLWTVLLNKEQQRGLVVAILCLVTSFFMSIVKVITTDVMNEKIHHQGKRKITQED